MDAEQYEVPHRKLDKINTICNKWFTIKSTDAGSNKLWVCPSKILT